MPNPKARALSFFDDYADMPHHRQSRALALLKAEDPALHDALVDLLVADALDHPLDRPPFELLYRHRKNHPQEDMVPRPDARLGSRLGPWQIDRLLASGGMGTVYQAHRADGHYQQRVALKCIRTELSSPALIKAFLNERNNLAQLEHPYIASLLDGGVEADGRPWFAMRYVEGQPIDQWCDIHGLTVRKRVELLVQSCDALAYAHGQRVLHQDIKPSNLLVTDEQRIQLVDFGLSSTLRADSDHPPRIAISNGYAAPESLASPRATVAMEVYSLGVVMYRLLCGDWPTPPELIAGHVPRALAHRPRAMATLVESVPFLVARVRGCRSARALARELAGDLSAIGLRCVATDPAQRYANMLELRDELQRWLQHQPVQARTGGAGYRTCRFLRRHWLSTGLTAGAGISLMAGVGVAAWQSRLARQESEATQTVSRLFESTLGTATLSGLGEARMSSHDLLMQTETRLRAQPLQAHPAVLARGLVTLARSYTVIGDYPHATRLANEAEVLSRKDHSQNADSSATLAALLNLQARHAEAKAAALSGLAQWKDGRHDSDGLVGVRLSTELARAYWGLGEYGSALEMLQTALAQAQAAPLDDAGPLAELMMLKGHWRSRLFQMDEAEQDLRRAIALADTQNPLIADSAREHLVRVLDAKGQHEASRHLAATLVASRRRLLGDEHPETGRAWVVLAESQYRHRQYPAAAASLAQGQRIVRKTYGSGHPEYAETLRLQSMLDSAGHDGTSAVRRARQAVAILERTLGPLHDTTLQAKFNLAERLIARPTSGDRADLPLPQLNEAIGLLEEIMRTGQQKQLPMPYQNLRYAQALMARGGRTGLPDLAVADTVLDRCLADFETYFGPHHAGTRRVRRIRERLQQQLRGSAEANAPAAPITGA